MPTLGGVTMQSLLYGVGTIHCIRIIMIRRKHGHRGKRLLVCSIWGELLFPFIPRWISITMLQKEPQLPNSPFYHESSKKPAIGSVI